MDTTRWFIREIIKSNAASIEKPREFTKWVIAGNAAMAGLILSNADSALALIGRFSCAIGMTFLALSIVCGFVAVIASNVIQGALLAIDTHGRIFASTEWERMQAEVPFNEEQFKVEYTNLLWGPLRMLVERAASNNSKTPHNKPIELAQSLIIGKATSTYVLFSILQMTISFFAIASMVLGMWC